MMPEKFAPELLRYRLILSWAFSFWLIWYFFMALTQHSRKDCYLWSHTLYDIPVARRESYYTHTHTIMILINILYIHYNISAQINKLKLKVNIRLFKNIVGFINHSHRFRSNKSRILTTYNDVQTLNLWINIYIY